TNTGNAATSTLAIALGGSDAAQFTIAGDTCSGTQLPPSATCTVSVKFTPANNAAVGARNAALTATAAAGGADTAPMDGTVGAATGHVYATGANGGGGFFGYDIARDAWSLLPNPPAATSSQLTSDGTAVYLLGQDNVIYRYSPANMKWTMTQAGPDPNDVTMP